jgi:hypothetical protein
MKKAASEWDHLKARGSGGVDRCGASTVARWTLLHSVCTLEYSSRVLGRACLDGEKLVYIWLNNNQQSKVMWLTCTSQ